VVITSASNSRVKRLVALRDRRDRDNEGVFVAEGMRAVERLVACNREIWELYVQVDVLTEEALRLVDHVHSLGVEIVELAPYPMAKASYRDHPEGLLAVCPQWKFALEDVQLRAHPLLLIAEGVEKPGNLGAILRTADATGCDAVIVSDPVVDIFNPNVIRAATAVVFSMPVVVSSPQILVPWLRERGVQTVATTPDTDLLHWDADFTKPTAVVMGAEDTGLSAEWFAASDVQVRLPMAGLADSLNVGVATAVVLYEAVRQRSAV
jgi:RNA methyltransferase, TrmH family